MTVVLRHVDSPLVVIELPAHRSDASTAIGDHHDGLVRSAQPASFGQREVDYLLCADHRSTARPLRAC